MPARGLFFVVIPEGNLRFDSAFFVCHSAFLFVIPEGNLRFDSAFFCLSFRFFCLSFPKGICVGISVGLQPHEKACKIKGL